MRLFRFAIETASRLLADRPAEVDALKALVVEIGESLREGDVLLMQVRGASMDIHRWKALVRHHLEIIERLQRAEHLVDVLEAKFLMGDGLSIESLTSLREAFSDQIRAVERLVLIAEDAIDDLSPERFGSEDAITLDEAFG